MLLVHVARCIDLHSREFTVTVTAVIFDVGGTLVDESGLWELWSRWAERSFVGPPGHLGRCHP
jgi:hypothetical protein